MFCTYCGTHNADDAVFCQSCGRRQQVATPPQIGARVFPPSSPLAATGGVSELPVAEQRVTDQAISPVSPPSAQLTRLNGGAPITTQPIYPANVGVPMPTPYSSNGGWSIPSETSVQIQPPPQTPQPRVTGGQTVMAFPNDTPNRVVLGGLAAILLGFFLPWMHLRFPGFFGIGATDTDLSALSGGWLVWLLIVVLVALGAFILCQEWLYRRYPQTPRWLLAMPFAVGIFMTAVSLYTVVLVLSLQAKLGDVGGDMAASLISTQIGVYLVLLSSIILAWGGYQKLVRELAAPSH